MEYQTPNPVTIQQWNRMTIDSQLEYVSKGGAVPEKMPLYRKWGTGLGQPGTCTHSGVLRLEMDGQIVREERFSNKTVRKNIMRMWQSDIHTIKKYKKTYIYVIHD